MRKLFLRNVYLKSLREFRWAILGWGVGTGLLLYVVLISVNQVMATAAARASLVAIGSQFSWLAAPIAIDTPGGYATFKYGSLILLISLWPLLACSRLLRGEEERGVMDVLLAQPRSRLSIAVEKLAAVWTALLLMALLIGILTEAGARQVKADFTFGDSLLFALDIVLMAAVMGGFSLLISQFTRERRTAAGVTGALLLVFVVLDMVHRVVPNTDAISRLSPIYYFNLSKPLIPSYGTDVGALLGLAGLAVILTAAGIALFVRRDVGGTVPLPAWMRRFQAEPAERAELPVDAWSLRSVYTRSLAMLAPATFWWTLGIAGFAAWMVEIVKQTESQLLTLAQSSPTMEEILNKIGGGATNTAGVAILSAVFEFLPLMLMAYAVVQAGRWASDEEDGQLEIVLSTPQPRRRVILTRFAALATTTLVVSLVTLGATAVAARATGLSLDQGNLAAATLGMIPLALLVAALGYVLSGWLRAAVDTGLLSLLVLAWFFITFVGPELNWPDATLRSSPLYYYGTPLLHGAQLSDVLALLAAGAALLVVATWRFARKDLV